MVIERGWTYSSTLYLAILYECIAREDYAMANMIVEVRRSVHSDTYYWTHLSGWAPFVCVVVHVKLHPYFFWDKPLGFSEGYICQWYAHLG